MLMYMEGLTSSRKALTLLLLAGECSWSLEWRIRNGEMPSNTASCPRVLHLYTVRARLSPKALDRVPRVLPSAALSLACNPR